MMVIYKVIWLFKKKVLLRNYVQGSVVNKYEMCDVNKKRTLNIPRKQLFSPDEKLSHIHIVTNGLTQSVNEA